MSPEVTLVMPVWRAQPHWFLEAVRSALVQEDCDLELVVVDDGNPDPVADLLAAVDDSRLRVVRIEHGGPAAARNAGVELARGRLIRFVDADDVLEHGSTARLAGLVGGRDDVVAYGATVVCDSELRQLRTIVSRFEGDAVVQCLLGRFDVRHVSMLFPRRVVERAGSWVDGFHVSEDWDFVLRALEHAGVRGDPLPATFYRRHGLSRTGVGGVAAGEEDRHRVIERYFERHPEQRGTRLARTVVAAAHLDRATAYAAVGERRLALDRLARAVRLTPRAGVASAARLAARELRRLAAGFGSPPRR